MIIGAATEVQRNSGHPPGRRPARLLLHRRFRLGSAVEGRLPSALYRGRAAVARAALVPGCLGGQPCPVGRRRQPMLVADGGWPAAGPGWLPATPRPSVTTCPEIRVPWLEWSRRTELASCQGTWRGFPPCRGRGCECFRWSLPYGVMVDARLRLRLSYRTAFWWSDTLAQWIKAKLNTRRLW